MKLRATMAREAGRFRAECLDEIAPCHAYGSTEQEAEQKLADEVRFFLEKCPCSWLPEDEISFRFESKLNPDF